VNDLTGLAAYHDASFEREKNLHFMILNDASFESNDEEHYEGHSIIRPITGYDVWDKTMNLRNNAFIIKAEDRDKYCPTCLHLKNYHSEDGCNLMFNETVKCNCPGLWTPMVNVILFKPSGKYYTEEQWRIPEGEVIPIIDPNPNPEEPRFRSVVGPYDMEFSPDFRRISGGHVLIPAQEPWGYPHLFPAESKVIKSFDKCYDCKHTALEHSNNGISPNDICHHSDDCFCLKFTTRAEQSQSYSQSAQLEHQSQYEEHQSSFRYQCKFQHVRTVGDLLVRMVSTLKSDPPEELGSMREQLSQPLLALLKCEEVECRDVRKLVGLILSNLLLE